VAAIMRATPFSCLRNRGEQLKHAAAVLVVLLASTNSLAQSPDAGSRLAVARFLCDHKYAADEPCDETAWLARVLADPWSGPDLLLHQDGGPQGAIWNADAPLVVFVSAEAGLVTLGKSKLAGTKAGAYRWARVPREQWYPALRARKGEPFRRLVLRVGKQNAGEVWFAEGE
jgi:hypothetical protein